VQKATEMNCSGINRNLSSVQLRLLC